MKKAKRNITIGLISILVGIPTSLTYPYLTFLIGILLIVVGHVFILSTKDFSKFKILSGLAFLLAGIVFYVFSLGSIFFNLLSYPFVLFGLVLILFSRSSLRIRLISAIVPLIIAFLFIQIRKGEDEIFLIPEGYHGPVRIYFEEIHGNNIDYENGKRVYIVPKSGVLFTNTKRTKYNKKEFYWLKTNGDRKQIMEIEHHVKDSIMVIPGWYSNTSGQHIFFLIGTFSEGIRIEHHDFKKEKIEKLRNELQNVTP